jgi:hypothetical protein
LICRKIRRSLAAAAGTGSKVKNRDGAQPAGGSLHLRVESTEKHNGAARTIEGQCMREARHWTDVLYLSLVCAIETPAIADSSGVTATAATEQHNSPALRSWERRKWRP